MLLQENLGNELSRTFSVILHIYLEFKPKELG